MHFTHCTAAHIRLPVTRDTAQHTMDTANLDGVAVIFIFSIWPEPDLIAFFDHFNDTLIIFC